VQRPGSSRRTCTSARSSVASRRSSSANSDRFLIRRYIIAMQQRSSRAETRDVKTIRFADIQTQDVCMLELGLGRRRQHCHAREDLIPTLRNT
jgi:hypothetical protein